MKPRFDNIPNDPNKVLPSPLTKLSLYKTDNIVLPSFADDLMTIDHAHDAELLEKFKRIEFKPDNPWTNTKVHSLKYNPQPQDEAKAFNTLKDFYEPLHLNFFLRNNLFLSRIFIQNAKRMRLLEQFADKDQINILDIGCGLACSLIGIMTYFGKKKINYVGVDINETSIAECKYSYNYFTCANFQKIDGREFLSDPEFAHKFDLVIIQHPDFTATKKGSCESFAELFVDTEKVLAEGGILYSTMYYLSEKNYFEENVLPRLKGFEKCELVESTICIEQDKPKETPISKNPFMPENYVFKSSPYQPKLLLTSSNLESRISPKSS